MTIKETEKMLNTLDILLDIAEEYYPKYSSSDEIAMILDIYKDLAGE